MDDYWQHDKSLKIVQEAIALYQIKKNFPKNEGIKISFWRKIKGKKNGKYSQDQNGSQMKIQMCNNDFPCF